jgi:hypothetical protein
MIALFQDDAVRSLVNWVNKNSIEVLNVAGKSAAKDERIYDVVYVVDMIPKKTILILNAMLSLKP